MIKRIFLIFFTLLLFVGNVGIPVFTHACEEDGVFHSYFIQSNSHCDESEKKELPPCCENKKTEKKNCCHDEKTFIQLKLDYSSTSNEFHYLEYTYCAKQIKAYYPNFVFSLEKEHVCLINNIPPPKPWGKMLLIQQQIFRI